MCLGTVEFFSQFCSLEGSESKLEVIELYGGFLAIHCRCMCSRVERLTVANVTGGVYCGRWEGASYLRNISSLNVLISKWAKCMHLAIEI
jgi:hypothetical protein